MQAYEAKGAESPLANRAGGPSRSPRIQIRYDERVAATRAGLGDAAFAAKWSEGRAMPLEQAIECALAAESQ